MKIFTLIRNVQYEGSSLLGAFTSIEDVLDHIDQMDGYCMDEFTVDREGFKFVGTSDLPYVQNATAGWIFDGPADMSFTVYEIALGA